MEDQNLNLLNYFDKFKEQPNFDKIKSKLDKESKFRYLGDINVGDVIIPFIGPGKNILKFHKIIEKEWGREIAQEIKFLLKYYDGGEIECIEEAIIILEIKYYETKNDNYLFIKDKLIKGENIEEINYQFLLDGDIMDNSILFYILGL